MSEHQVQHDHHENHKHHENHEHHVESSILDRFWPLAVIGVGVAFVLTVALFHPYH